MYKYIYLLLAGIAIAGCQRTVDCSDGMLKLDLTAYNKAERDTVVIDMYENGVLLSSDTSRIGPYNDYELTNDSKYHRNTPDGLNAIGKTDGITLDIILPATGKTYKLSDFKSYPRTIKVSSRYKEEHLCFNNKLGVSLDGVPMVLEGDGSYTLKLNK